MLPRSEPLESLYQVAEEIGNGQSAVVRRVVERSTGRSFAAKLVRRRRGAAAGPRRGDEWREASVLASLRHPNLVALHETFETPQHVVLVLELVSGGELEALLDARGGRLAEAAAADVVTQVLRGLEYMHSHGIAHLDLKPENVMVSGLEQPWRVKLIDFGLSREVAGGGERALQGTPEFLAPEAVNFEPLSLSTDIWALGVIMYLLLSGASPFLGEDKQETFCNIVAGDFDISAERFENVSVLAPHLISRILVQNPKKRPTASECLRDAWFTEIELRTSHFDGGAPVVTSEETTTLTLKQRARRRWKTWVQVIALSRHLTQRNVESCSEQSSSPPCSTQIFDQDVASQSNPFSDLICDSQTLQLTTFESNDNQSSYQSQNEENIEEESKLIISDKDLFIIPLINDNITDCSNTENFCLQNITSSEDDDDDNLNSLTDIAQTIETELGSNNSINKKSINNLSSINLMKCSDNIEYNVIYKPQETPDDWENRIPSFIPSSVPNSIGDMPESEDDLEPLSLGHAKVNSDKFHMTLDTDDSLPVQDEDSSFCKTSLDTEECSKSEDVAMAPTLEAEVDKSTEGEPANSEVSTPVASAERLSAALAGAELEATDSRGETPIFWAARQGNAEAIRLLAAAGAMIGAQNKLGETSLHVACRYGHASVVSALCLLPLDLDHPDFEGESALHAASARGHAECVRRLIDAGASLDLQEKRHGSTPLLLALRRHHTRVALLLLHAGADLELPDLSGESPLHVSAHEGLLAVSQTLCAYGCRVDVPNEAGLLPLHLAARRGHTELVRCLCLAGCDVERRNVDGIKAEITALKHGHHEAAELLARLSNVRQRDEFIRQLIPSSSPLSRLTVKILGHSGVGKSALVDTLGAGLLASLFRRSKGAAAAVVSRSHPTSPSKTHIEMDVTAKSKDDSLSFDSRNLQGGTRGVDVRMLSIAGVGEVSAWDFSGQEAYLPVYHHFLSTGANSAVHVLVCSLEDPPVVRLQQLLFWLSFLQARVKSTEPLGVCGGPQCPVRVVLVATHADSARCPRSQAGDYVSTEVDWLLEQLVSRFSPALQLYPQAFVLDAHVPGSPGLRGLKSCLLDLRNQTMQVRPRGSGLLDSTLRWLQSWRRNNASFPVTQWAGFAQLVRAHVNPLAGEEHLRELLQQLVFMGEASWIRNAALVVLCPRWLGVELVGQLLSPEFLASARATGCYTCDDFQAAFPQGAEAYLNLHVLEALDLCVQCENDGELEYEFPCFNLVETLDGLWDPEDPRYVGAVYSGVRIRAQHQLAWLFPRLQVQLRRASQAAAASDPDTDLYQWLHGSKLCTGLLESLITLERGGDIEIKVRGPESMRLSCFYFLEEILGVLEQVVESVTPGLPPERRVLSAEQLRAHVEEPFSWAPEAVLESALKAGDAGMQATLKNTSTGQEETLLDVLACGAPEVVAMMVLGTELPVTALGLTARQSLCCALDPPEPLGRDWCLLAVSLGLGERLAMLEGAPCPEQPRPSPTARLLDEWLRVTKTATIGILATRLRELGREDSCTALLHHAPLYRVIASDECWSDEADSSPEDGLLDTSSSNLSR